MTQQSWKGTWSQQTEHIKTDEGALTFLAKTLQKSMQTFLPLHSECHQAPIFVKDTVNQSFYLPSKKNSPTLLSGPDQFWENRMNVLLYLSRKWGSANLGCWHALVIKEFFCCGKASELPWFFFLNVKFKSLAIYGCEMWGWSLHYHFRTASLWGEEGGGHGTLHFVLLMDNPLGGHIHWQEETKQLWQI